MARLVCVSCQLPYRCHVGGVDVVETAGREQRPYRLWKADLYRCPGCGHEVVTAFGYDAWASDWDEGFGVDVDRVVARDPFYMREFPAAVESR